MKFSMPLDLANVARLAQLRAPQVLQPKVPDLIEFIPPKHRELSLPTVSQEVIFLREIALLFGGAPYGGVMEFCEATNADPDLVWRWAKRYGRE